MKIIKGLEQNSAEWLIWRKNRIGASDTPKIMGGFFCSQLELWERKLGISPEQPQNFAMSRGQALEEDARHSFQTLKKISITPQVVEHQEYSWMVASLDGLSFCEKYAVEIKCPGRKDHDLALNGEIPEKYYPQLQHQLEVTGLDMIYYYSYDGQNNACIEVKRDQHYIDKMMVELKKFYKCMITCTPPELTEKDFNIRVDEECKIAVANWRETKTQLEFWTLAEKKAREDILLVSPSQSWKGFGVKVQKIMRLGPVDYSAIPALEAVNLDQYRKPDSVSWRITVDE